MKILAFIKFPLINLLFHDYNIVLNFYGFVIPQSSFEDLANKLYRAYFCEEA